MSKDRAHLIASLLWLAALIVIVVGVGGADALWQLGLALVLVGLGFAFATRYVGEDRDGDHGGEDDEARADRLAEAHFHRARAHLERARYYEEAIEARRRRGSADAPVRPAGDAGETEIRVRRRESE